MRYAVLVTLALAWVAVAGPAFAEGGTPSLFAAHRGGSLLWTENSLLAFRNALLLGADFLEFDVHLSRDGEVVVIHDSTLDRTTTGAGPVREKTAEALRALRLKGPRGEPTEERIPTLDEVTALAKAGRRRMLLEIKVDDRRQRYAGIEEKVLAALDRHDMAGACVVMSFEPETWRRVRALRPDVAAGALYSANGLRAAGQTPRHVVQEASRSGVRFVGLHQSLVDDAAVSAARDAGVLLGVWTVNEESAVRRFIDLGVGVVITDRPDVAKALLGR